jgi:hypothetical protein
MSRLKVTVRLLVAAVLLCPQTGCIAAAAAAGAAGAIAYSERGAESEVVASVPALVQATEATFSEMNIVIVERKTAENGSEVQLAAKKDEMDVTIDIQRDNDSTSRIEITARRNLVDYDRNFARDLLQRILKRVS